MIKQSIVPLALAVGVALAVAGCSKGAPNHRATTPTASPPTSTVPHKATAPASAQSATLPASAATAATIALQPIAFTVDNQYNACNNFATYVNAKWNKANPIPSDSTRWGSFGYLHKKSLQEQRQILEKAAADAKNGTGSELEQKLGRLYAAGMDTAAVNKLSYTPIKPALTKIAAIKTPAGIVNFINDSYTNGDGYVFGFSAHADQKNAMKQIAYISQAGLGLPTREYYLSSKPRYKQIRQAYVNYIAKSFELVGTPDAQAKKQAQSVLDFETDLAKASLSPTQLNNPDNQYHFVTVAQADKMSPHFSWADFFKSQGVTIDKGFSLSQPKFIKEFNKLLASAPVSHWQAYLKFHLINTASPALSTAFQDNHFDFYNKTLQGQPEQKPRWKRVVRDVNFAMGMGLGKLYVAKYFPPEDKARAEKLVANIRAAFKEHVEHLTWMSDATKKKAIAKLALYLPKIGYPDKGEWRDYSGLTIQPGHFFANLQAAMKYNYQWQIGHIGKKTDRKHWFMTPQTINAYYSDSTNTINFPAAILQPPFFYAHGDPAVNYGGIGYVIGHETTHGFDKYGSEFNGYGDRVNWWTKQDRKKFNALEAELSQQYDHYAPIPGKPDLHVKGEMTIREDTADLGGLNIAYT
ncbi:MAG: M13 family metallopeptidase, partial [Gammaproteobacteria bacterium]